MAGKWIDYSTASCITGKASSIISLTHDPKLIITFHCAYDDRAPQVIQIDQLTAFSGLA